MFLNFCLARVRLELCLSKNICVLFNYNYSFAKAIKERCTAANRAMFLLLKRCTACLPLDIQLELFQKCIYSILLYGCEV
jgi:hypothetical protein